MTNIDKPNPNSEQNTQKAIEMLQQIEEQQRPIIKTRLLNSQFEPEYQQNFVKNFDDNLKKSQLNQSVIIKNGLNRTLQGEEYTDNQILIDSGQLANDSVAQLIDNQEDLTKQIGVAVESLDVSLKQWQFSVHWQKTKVLKSGLINRLKKREQSMDLDLSCLLCNRYGEVVERVWFKNVRDQAEAIRYQGDELIGDRVLHTKQSNDEPEHIAEKRESIALFLARIPPHIYQVALVLSSYTGHELKQVQQGECLLSDDEGNIILKLNLPKLQAEVPAIWVATISRSANSWRLVEQVQGLKSYQQADFEKEISEQLIRNAR